MAAQAQSEVLVIVVRCPGRLSSRLVLIIQVLLFDQKLAHHDSLGKVVLGYYLGPKSMTLHLPHPIANHHSVNPCTPQLLNLSLPLIRTLPKNPQLNMGQNSEKPRVGA